MMEWVAKLGHWMMRILRPGVFDAKSRSSYSVANLLCDGDGEADLSVDEMIESLKTHKVTLPEVKSMEEELESKLHGAGGVELITLAVLISTAASTAIFRSISMMATSYLTVVKMLSGLGSNGKGTMVKYFEKHPEVITHLSRWMADGFMVAFIMAAFAIVGYIALLCMWGKSSMHKRMNQALHEYERSLMGEMTRSWGILEQEDNSNKRAKKESKEKRPKGEGTRNEIVV